MHDSVKVGIVALAKRSTRSGLLEQIWSIVGGRRGKENGRVGEGEVGGWGGGSEKEKAEEGEVVEEGGGGGVGRRRSGKDFSISRKKKMKKRKRGSGEWECVKYLI